MRISRLISDEPAFKLFLQNNIEKVTVPELERVTKLQRGAIFYHFKDKEAIFKEAIDTYFFSPLNIFSPIVPDGIYSLEEYWDKKNEHLVKIQSWFNKEKYQSIRTLLFFILRSKRTYIFQLSEKICRTYLK